MKALSVLMFAVFLYGTAPREYLHDLFAGHKDTVERNYKKGQFGISKKHVHCAFLSIEFGPFLATAKQYLSFRHIVPYTKWTSPHYVCHFFSAHRVTSLRGPPALLFV